MYAHKEHLHYKTLRLLGVPSLLCSFGVHLCFLCVNKTINYYYFEMVERIPALFNLSSPVDAAQTKIHDEQQGVANATQK